MPYHCRYCSRTGCLTNWRVLAARSPSERLTISHSMKWTNFFVYHSMTIQWKKISYKNKIRLLIAIAVYWRTKWNFFVDLILKWFINEWSGRWRIIISFGTSTMNEIITTTKSISFYRTKMLSGWIILRWSAHHEFQCNMKAIKNINNILADCLLFNNSIADNIFFILLFLFSPIAIVLNDCNRVWYLLRLLLFFHCFLGFLFPFFVQAIDRFLFIFRFIIKTKKEKWIKDAHTKRNKSKSKWTISYLKRHQVMRSLLAYFFIFFIPFWSLFVRGMCNIPFWFHCCYQTK